MKMFQATKLLHCFIGEMSILKANEFRGERGIVLILGLLLLLILTLIGISALSTSIYDIRISGNEKSSVQAFYVAEAGINELMARFRTGVTNPIPDSDPLNPAWRLLLAKDSGKGATTIGYVSTDPNSISSLQDQLDFGVEIKHKIDAKNQVVQYGGVPVYLIRSYGFSIDGGNKILEVELLRSPDYDPPAAFYSGRPIHVHGSSIYLNGNDGCGTVNKPGIITITTTNPPIAKSGNPSVDGSPPEVTLTSDPPPINLPIREMIDYLKGDADFKYAYDENQTLTGYSDNWGTPSHSGIDIPISYSGPMNIVYFNMNGDKTLRLAGDSHGAGILVVEGNLEITGDFTWYGIILVAGAVNYTGGGEKNVTGGIFSGENTSIDVNIDGITGILFCSAVSSRLKEIIPPLKITRWREVF